MRMELNEIFFGVRVNVVADRHQVILQRINSVARSLLQ